MKGDRKKHRINKFNAFTCKWKSSYLCSSHQSNNNMDVVLGKTLDASGWPLHKMSVSASALKKMKEEDVSNTEMQQDPKFKDNFQFIIDIK